MSTAWWTVRSACPRPTPCAPSDQRVAPGLDVRAPRSGAARDRRRPGVGLDRRSHGVDRHRIDGQRAKGLRPGVASARGPREPRHTADAIVHRRENAHLARVGGPMSAAAAGSAMTVDRVAPRAGLTASRSPRPPRASGAHRRPVRRSILSCGAPASSRRGRRRARDPGRSRSGTSSTRLICIVMSNGSLSSRPATTCTSGGPTSARCSGGPVPDPGTSAAVPRPHRHNSQRLPHARPCRDDGTTSTNH